jgi:aspartate/methionine/tyrosine aminotransferase
MQPESRVARRLAPFGTTIFTEMTRLAVQHGAINLAQGFPDFDGPEFAKEAAIAAVRAGKSQYARMLGDPVLNRAIAAHWRRRAGADIDPDTNVSVTSGCTEAIAATFLGLINPGDKVVLFEPYYDSYRACVALAGGEPVFVPLTPPEGVRDGERRGTRGGAIVDRAFSFDEQALRRAFAARPRAIVLNTPHNPTGKVYTHAELALIASLCVEHDVLAITDEVYEFLTYDDALPHLRLATYPGMWERTVTLSSIGKTFSLTGWKIGWAIADAALIRAVRAAHQFLTFATATPLQHAAAAALEHGDEYIAGLRADFVRKRDFLGEVLAELGMTVFRPHGTYFIMADHSGLNLPAEARRDDRSFCEFLTREVRVAAIPPSVFYDTPSLGKSLARFAFCKNQTTLDEASARLRAGIGIRSV